MTAEIEALFKKVYSSTEVKNICGEVLEAAQRSPVLVKKNGRASLVILSYVEYERLKEIEFRLESLDK